MRGKPVVVDIYEFVTRVKQAFFYHSLAGIEYKVLVNRVFESIPTCPTHRRSERNAVVVFFSQIEFCRSLMRSKQHF